MKTRLFFVFLALLCVFFTVHAEKVMWRVDLQKSFDGKMKLVSWRDQCRPTVALAFSGGSAYGFAHIGVLHALEKEGIYVDYVSGTSMGAIVGGFYAAGYSPQELEQLIRDIDWDAFFSLAEKPQRKILLKRGPDPKKHLAEYEFLNRQAFGIFSGEAVLETLGEYTVRADYLSGGDFNKLDKPFRAVAVDIYGGREYVFQSGNLGYALRASSSLPFAFSPIEYEDTLLVDGGILNNLPLDKARDFNPDIVIGSDLVSDYIPREEIYYSSPLNLLNRILFLSREKVQVENYALADFIFTTHFTRDEPSLDFDRWGYVSRGEIQAYSVIQDLKEIYSAKKQLKEDPEIFKKQYINQGIVLSDASLRHLSSYVEDFSQKHPQLTKAQLYDFAEQLFIEHGLADVSVDITVIGNAIHAVVHAIPVPAITSIVITGNTVFTSQTLHSKLSLSLPSSNNYQFRNYVSQKIENLYISQGYLLTFVSVSSNLDDSQSLVFHVKEIPIEKIHLEGLTADQKRLVSTFLQIQEGDVFNVDLMRDTVNRLRGLGIFSKVESELSRGSGGVVITFHFTDEINIVANLDVYYYSEEDVVSFFGALEVRNFDQKGAHVTLAGMLGYEDGLSLQATSPYMFYSRFGGTVGTSIKQAHYRYWMNDEKYDFEPIVFGINLGVENLLHPDAHIGVDIQWDKLFYEDSEMILGGNDEIFRFSLVQQLNTMEREYLPKYGIKYTIKAMTSHYADPEVQDFSSLHLSAKQYFSFNNDFSTIWVSGKGHVFSDGDLSIIEYEGLGGIYDLPGVPEDYYRGPNMFAASFGYRQEVIENVWGELGWYGGSAFMQTQDFSDEFVSSFAYGLNWPTYVGLVKIVWGNTDEWDDTYCYFLVSNWLE
ncbi:patatin-like phospholipase family protein [Candidatus Margulisiibacteriota bacterium]